MKPESIIPVLEAHQEALKEMSGQTQQDGINFHE